MAEVDRLLRAYVEHFEEAGFADPREYLSKVKGRERRELEALIEGYLEHAPAQHWDARAFEGSLAERAVSRVADQWSAAGAEPPPDLAELRNKRRLPRGELISRLADALGVAPQREKVALYYHRMENGLLPAGGISTRVFEALADLLETSTHSIRAAVLTSTGPDEAATYARLATPQQLTVESADAVEPTRSAEAEAADWDEVDRLFLEGER